MTFQRFVMLSITLAILYVLIAKSDVFVQLTRKVGEWVSKGITVLTTGGVK